MLVGGKEGQEGDGEAYFAAREAADGDDHFAFGWKDMRDRSSFDLDCSKRIEREEINSRGECLRQQQEWLLCAIASQSVSRNILQPYDSIIQ